MTNSILAKLAKVCFIGASGAFLATVVWSVSARVEKYRMPVKKQYEIQDTNKTAPPKKDTAKKATPLRYPFKDKSTGNPMDKNPDGTLFLSTPSNVNSTVDYDPKTGTYQVDEKMGNLQYRPPMRMTMKEYMEYDMDRQMKGYWKQRSKAENLNNKAIKGLIPKLYINNEVFDRIFGGNNVDIRPNGSAELIFEEKISRTDNPSIPVRYRTLYNFNFGQKIQLNVIGKIGDKLKVTMNYNTEATFDFENQMKLEYTGYEDDIIKKIEAGNVTLPLTGTLITGSQNLFGIKTQLQFGRTTFTGVASQQKGKKQTVEVSGGAQINNYEVKGDNYEANRHYFISQYFLTNYDRALANLPIITSGITINKMEVWVTNTVSSTGDTRNLIALTDLGELQGNINNPAVVVPSKPAGGPPDNANNNLDPATFASPLTSPQLRDITTVSAELTKRLLNNVNDFEKVTLAKKLTATEYTFNKQLGYISLNSQLNSDQVLAVAFQYTLNGQVYQVGEFSTDGVVQPQCLYVKMLKSTNVSPRRDVFLWNLMMKNVYALGTYQLRKEDFKLEILYNNPATGTYVNVVPESGLPVSGRPLIQVLNMDRLNSQSSANPDGIFDFLDGITVNTNNGRIYFPVAEPFGAYLKNQILGTPPNINNQTAANKYTFPQLYDSSRVIAQQFPDKNRFILRGTYKSAAGSEISLNAANIPQGSVVVTAGGVPLTENVDYNVDYSMGRVKIINESILQSGVPIKVESESNSLYTFQTKTFMGARIDHRVNKDFNLGSTIINLSEKPLTQKVNIGDEPINNTVVGFDGNYRTEAPFLTRAIDKLPFLATKEISTITSSFEVAKLFPGHASAIGKSGNSYVDDFEGSQSTIDIKNFSVWSLASTPQGQPNLFPEASADSTISGFNRARIAWYSIDPILLRDDPGKPAHLTKEEQSNHFVRQIFERELFVNKESSSGQPNPLATLDLAYYPEEIGQYNYDAAGIPGISSGLSADGKLKDADKRWAGIMRKVDNNDFEANNVEFIQFWVMDPYVRDPNTGLSPDYKAQFGNTTDPSNGELYFNIGNISEDVLKDGRKSFENGLPTPDNTTLPTKSTPWGKIPMVQALVNAFSNGQDAVASRLAQDIGLDGVNDADEAVFFNAYLQQLATTFGTSSAAYQNAVTDASNDRYHYFRGTDYDAAQTTILNRYKYFNGMEGNSPVQDVGDYSTTATTIPNTEDINNDNNLSENESYYQYKLKISSADFDILNVGKNYLTDVVLGTDQNNPNKQVNWYQFKIPIREFTAQNKIGNIEDFKSIRFIRMFMKGFKTPMVMRFARLELVRGEWRKYTYDLKVPGEYIPVDNSSGTTFDVSAVNFQENGAKRPVNYVIPPSISQEVDVQTANLVRLNEQALALRVCGLRDGDSRAAYKNTELDVRSYKRLKMFVHAESAPTGPALKDGDLHLFVRLGTDYTGNYYEYEIPLKITPPNKYNNTSDADKLAVWLPDNEMDIEFSVLQNAKQQRNNKIAAGTSSLNKEERITVTDAAGRPRIITIKGNPNLSTLKTIMVGVRNPKNTASQDNDDGMDKCGEVWINELRLTDFDEEGGWAATARTTAKLADLGTLSLSGNISTPGWGSIDKKVSERKRETVLQYDVSSQLELGRFFPQRINLHIPMYVGYSEGRINPQFNPADPDIELSGVFKDPLTPQHIKDSLRTLTQDFTKRRSINFSNVKKDKSKGNTKSHFYDIENFSLNLVFNEFYNRNFMVSHYLTQEKRGGFAYNFSKQPKNIKPLEKVLGKSKSFQILRDFNFYPYPGKFSFITDINRFYSERLIRNTSGEQYIKIDTTYDKRFTWARNYDVGYDISKSLRLSYTADNLGVIREPYGKLSNAQKRDSVRDEILKLGTTTRFSHRIKLDYAVPINKIPLLDWVTVTTSYSASYDWMRAPFANPPDSLGNEWGNTLQNSNQKQVNGQLNLISFYNKSGYLRKVNQKYQLKANSRNQSNPLPSPKPVVKKDSTKKKDENRLTAFDHVAHTLMMVKNVNLTYSENAGTILPGYLANTTFFGLDNHAPYSGSGFAPGFSFITGDQKDVRPQLKRDNLLTKAQINIPFSQTNVQKITGRAVVEPFTDFKITLNLNRDVAKNNSELYLWNENDKDFRHNNPTETGTFSMSTISIGTAFESRDPNFSTNSYRKFLNNRTAISSRLHESNPNSNTVDAQGYWKGYGSTSQDVMLYSFLATYSGGNASSYSLNRFPTIPLPNWSVIYDGLSKMAFVKKYFRTVTISHAYRSSTSFSYQTNLNYSYDVAGNPNKTDVVGNFILREQVAAVILTEQFSPLFKIDVALNNNITATVEVKRDRNVGLSLSNGQLTEINGREYLIGGGYRIPNFVIRSPFGSGKNRKTFKSDLILRLDLSFRNNVTVIRHVDQDYNEATAGQNIVALKFSADYVLSERLNVRLFYDHIINTPVISNTYRTSTINTGVSLRFTLSQ